MTVFLSLLITMLSPAGTVVQQDAWIANLLKSRDAQEVLRSHDRQAKPQRSLPSPTEVKLQNGSSFLLLDPSVGPVYERASQKVSMLLDEGRDMDAYLYLSDVRKDFPQADQALLDLSIECELLAAHYSEAFRDAVVRVNAGGFGGEEQNLYLSLGSAALGHVFPGQAKYCEKWIGEHLANQGSSVRPQATARELDSHEVMVLSCVALGTKDVPGFLEMALRLDPVNELAAHQAIRYYGFKGRYSDLRRVALSVAELLPAGEAKTYYLKQVALVAKLKDRPQRPVIKP